MIKILLLLFVLISACVVIHGIGMILGLRWINHTRAGDGWFAITSLAANHCLGRRAA
jgi:hypothetical protein